MTTSAEYQRRIDSVNRNIRSLQQQRERLGDKIVSTDKEIDRMRTRIAELEEAKQRVAEEELERAREREQKEEDSDNE